MVYLNDQSYGIVQEARRIAQSKGSDQITTSDLLVALVQCTDTHDPANRILERYGITESNIAEVLHRVSPESMHNGSTYYSEVHQLALLKTRQLSQTFCLAEPLHLLLALAELPKESESMQLFRLLETDLVSLKIDLIQGCLAHATS